MNEERAKKVLQEQIDKYGQEYDAEGIEAIKKAIEVLEQQPCEDCVSREAIKEKKVYSEERHEYVVPVAEIDWLPSVQPQSLEQIKWERDTAIEQLEQLGYGLGEKVKPCEDCVSRKELLSRIDAERRHLLDIGMDGAEHIIVHHARRIIEDMPSVKPQRPKGKWIEEKGEYGVWSCSECKELFILTEGTPMDNEYHYCPNCGSYNGGKTNGNE